MSSQRVRGAPRCFEVGARGGRGQSQMLEYFRDDGAFFDANDDTQLRLEY